MQFNIFKTNRAKNILLAIILILLAVGNISFAINDFLQLSEIKNLQTELAAQQTNAKVADFLNLFVDKVLKTDQPVSFDDRLRLENAVRDINDPGILATWEEFTAATTEAQVQQGVKDLLSALAKKLVY